MQLTDNAVLEVLGITRSCICIATKTGVDTYVCQFVIEDVLFVHALNTP